MSRHPWPRAFRDAGITPTESAVWGPPGDESSPYRYSLSYTWDPTLPRMVGAGINPSDASPKTGPDPTVCRWLTYALAWGFGGLDAANAYPLRATSMDDFRREVFAIKGHPRQEGCEWEGPSESHGLLFLELRRIIRGADLVLASWGAGFDFGAHPSILRTVLESEQVPLACLAVTKDGRPVHPLARTAGLKLAGAWPLTWPGLEPLQTPRACPVDAQQVLL